MRAHIRLIETFLCESADGAYYREGADWLHGGPSALRSGRFERRGRRGKDMGGLYFVRGDVPGAWRVALAYTFRYAEGAVWRCRIDLSHDEVFDLTNRRHQERLSEIMAPEDVTALRDYAQGGHLPWARSEGWQAEVERMLTSLGFKGSVMQERGGGATGAGTPHVSLCVFDPSVVRVIERTARKDGLAVHGASTAF